ncbi:MAG: hypothetical protein MZW92_05800 [Comamonadaceae bacterium]|nr:hypothetical protein [Comamonadaceae bacterium]
MLRILAQTMHNLLPVRGAKVRDALRWSNYLDQALEQTADAEVYFGQHNWPIWGQDTHRRVHHQAPRRLQIHP